MIHRAFIFRSNPKWLKAMRLKADSEIHGRDIGLSSSARFSFQ